MRKLTVKEVEYLAQDHTESRWLIGDVDPVTVVLSPGSCDLGGPTAH